MDLLEVMDTRRSIRNFDGVPVSEEQLDRILETVRLSPSAGNLQSFQVIVIRDLAIKKQLVHASWGQNFLAEAPVVLGFIADRKHAGSRYGTRGRELYALQDATIAATYAMLAAADVGLGCVWVGAFDTRKVAEILNYKEDEVPVALLAVGHPVESPEPRLKRELTELVRRL